MPTEAPLDAPEHDPSLSLIVDWFTKELQRPPGIPLSRFGIATPEDTEPVLRERLLDSISHPWEYWPEPNVSFPDMPDTSSTDKDVQVAGILHAIGLAESPLGIYEQNGAIRALQMNVAAHIDKLGDHADTPKDFSAFGTDSAQYLLPFRMVAEGATHGARLFATEYEGRRALGISVIIDPADPTHEQSVSGFVTDPQVIETIMTEALKDDDGTVIWYLWDAALVSMEQDAVRDLQEEIQFYHSAEFANIEVAVYDVNALVHRRAVELLHTEAEKQKGVDVVMIDAVRAYEQEFSVLPGNTPDEVRFVWTEGKGKSELTYDVRVHAASDGFIEFHENNKYTSDEAIATVRQFFDSMNVATLEGYRAMGQYALDGAQQEAEELVKRTSLAAFFGALTEKHQGKDPGGYWMSNVRTMYYGVARPEDQMPPPPEDASSN